MGGKERQVREEGIACQQNRFNERREKDLQRRGI